jgi:hypothetical protein
MTIIVNRPNNHIAVVTSEGEGHTMITWATRPGLDTEWVYKHMDLTNEEFATLCRALGEQNDINNR